MPNTEGNGWCGDFPAGVSTGVSSHLKQCHYVSIGTLRLETGLSPHLLVINNIPVKSSRLSFGNKNACLTNVRFKLYASSFVVQRKWCCAKSRPTKRRLPLAIELCFTTKWLISSNHVRFTRWLQCTTVVFAEICGDLLERSQTTSAIHQLIKFILAGKTLDLKRWGVAP